MVKLIHTIPSAWRGWLSAWQFLTIFTWRSKSPFDARAALPFFPMVGLAMGALLLAVDTVAGLVWPRPVVALLDLSALIWISGALHLDGVADTADGLYGRRTPEQAMAIMKDSRVGAMGLVAVICCLAFKWVGLATMESAPHLWLLLIPAYARAAVLVGIKSLPYGRPQEGTGHVFFEKPIGLTAFCGFIPLVLLSLFLGWDTLKLNVGFLVIVMAVLTWYRRKLGAITGDMLGALIEFTEAGLFTLAAMQWVHT